MSRFGSVTQRKVLKEKIVQQYELIFRSQDVSLPDQVLDF